MSGAYVSGPEGPSEIEFAMDERLKKCRSEEQFDDERTHWRDWFDRRIPPNPHRAMYLGILEEKIDRRRETLEVGQDLGGASNRGPTR